MARQTLRRLERWRLFRLVLDFHAVTGAHAFLGRVTFGLALVRARARREMFRDIHHLPRSAAAAHLDDAPSPLAPRSCTPRRT